MTTPTEPSPVDAYALLSRPTLEITDDELKIIVADLRRKREAFVSSGGKAKDTPGKVKKKPVTAEEKADLTKGLLASLNLKI